MAKPALHLGAPSPEPSRDCPACPRLAAFRELWREREPQWHNAPVPSFADPRGDEHVRLLIVGLAPGLRGANRTGRPFTGDYAGDLLYATLEKHGFATGEYRADPGDGLTLRGCAITNSVRCVPPENKPVGSEINTCRHFLVPTIGRFPNLEAVMTLGRIAHDSTLRALGVRMADAPFSHGGRHAIGPLQVFSSYHCSRYNTNTNRLTPQMFEAVVATIAQSLGANGRG
jgi:uracil-DNA glycosylase family 4